MPKLVPTVGTVVVRDGQRVRPTIGKPFDYTKEEADQIREEAPNALVKQKDVEDDGDEAVPASNVTGKAGVKPSAEASQAKARGGAKTATAAKSDEEASQDEDL
jgi:hypothetical protein